MIHASAKRQESAGAAIAFPRMGSRSWCSGALAALAVVLALPSLAVAQTNGTWNVDANGSWSTTTNWLGNTVASGTNAAANFANVNLIAARTITVDGNYTIGSMNVGDTDALGTTLDTYTFSSGTLTLANTTGSPTINVALGGATGQRRVQFNTILAGTSGLTVTQSGGGTGGFAAVALKGINTFTGNLTVGSGTYASFMYLDIGNNSTTGEAAQLGSGNFAGNIDIQGNNQIRFMTTLNNNLSGIISGGAGTAITLLAGTGTTTLSAANTFSGSIVLPTNSSGVSRLSLGHANALQNGRLVISSTNTLRFSPSIGTFNVGRVSGAGGFALTATDNSAVTLAIGGNSAGASDTISGTVSGVGGLTKVGSGTLTLSAANTYTGTTAINGGMLIANNAAALGTGTVTFGGGTLQYGSGITTDLSSRIAASGSAIAVDTGANNVAWATGLASTNTGGLTKLGSGTLTLSASNAYTGTTTITAGQLSLSGGDNRLATNAPITITGGVLDLGSRGQSTSGMISFQGGTVQSGTLTSTGGAFDGQAGTVSAILAGSGIGLTKTTSGLLTLSAANSYSGGTTIRNGSVAVTSPANLGSGTIAITPDAAATTTSLRLNNTASGTYTQPITMSSASNPAFAAVDASSATAQVTLSGGITVSNNAFLVRLVAPTGTTGSLVVDGNITGTGDLQLTGNGGAGVIQRDVNIGSAILYVAGAGSTWSIGGGAYTWGTTNIQLATSALRTTVDGVLPSSSALSFNSAAGALDINGTRQTVGSVGGSVAGSRIILGSGTLTVSNTNASTFAGVISGTGGGLVKTNSGTLTLSNANTYTGTTAINAGVLSMGSAAALGTGTVTFGGGTLQYGSGITADLSGRIAASGSAISVDTGANTVAWATGLASTNIGGLTKLGSGTLALSAANTYTGPTAVNAGVLAMNNAAALGTGTDTVTFGGGTLQYGSGITADLSGRIAASGSAIAVDTGANNVAWATGLASTNTGGLTKLGSGTLTLSASNAYTGASTISAGRLVVGHVNALGSSTSALAVNGGTLDLDGRSISVGALSGSSGATITTNSSPGTATLTTTVNSNSTFAGSIADNGSGRVALTKTGNSGLTLTGTNTFTGDISVAGGVLDLGTTGLLGSGSYGGNISIAGVTQFRIMANANQTLSGTISGDGTLWMVTSGLGTGTTTLTAANTLTGQVLAGNQFSSSGFLVPTLQLGNGNALQSARLVVSASNKLVFSPGIGTFNVGSLEASGTLQGDLTLQDTSGAGITLSAGGNNLSTTYARVLSGSGNLTKVGSGTLTLSAANTYTGTTAINGGVLTISNAAALGTTGTITFGGGTLQYGSGITADLSGRIAASGSAIAVDTGANNVAWATGLASTNTGGLTKLGSGALTLSAANNYSGVTTIRNGAVAVTSPANLGSGTIAITPDAGTSTPSLRLNNTVSGTYTQPITMSSINNPAYAVIDASSATAQVTLSGGITVSNNAFLARLVAPTGTTGSLVVDGNITGTGDLQLMGNGGAGVIQKDVNIGSATLNVGSGGSTWSIGGGAYTWGTTNIQLAGSALRTTADGVLPSASALSFNSAAGALDINGTRQTVGSVGSSVAGSRIILGSGTLTVSNTNASTFAGVISGTGGGLVKTNSGTLTLSNANTYTGGSTISAGRLVVGNAAALGSSSAALAVNGGTLDLGGFSVGVGALSGSAGAVITTATTAGTATLTSAVASGTSIFRGVIQDNGSGLVALTKSGAGVLDLLGANTYSGATSVSAGTLLVTGQLGNTAVTVDSGATLGGSGSIAGAVTVNGLFSPGTSPGLLRVGALTLGTSGTSLFEIDGLTRGSQYDGTNVTGALTYGGSLVIDFGNSITEAFGDNTIFNLFDFGSYTGAFTSITTANDGSFYGGLTFTSVGAGDTWTATKDSQTLEFTHSNGELVIVPEPGAIALAAIGIAAAAWARRRTHHK